MFLKQIKKKKFANLNFSCFNSFQRLFSSIDSSNLSNLLSSSFKLGRVADAGKLFDKLTQRDIVSWSIAIHGYAINGFPEKSMKLFSRMRLSGLVPNSFTLVGALVGTAGLSDLMLSKSVHGHIIKSGLGSDLIVGTAMLDVYGKCGNVLDSYKVFEELKNPGLITCNAVIAGLINNGFYGDAFMLFDEFRKFVLVPNVATLLSLIKGCLALGVRMLCESVFCLIIKLGLSSNVSVDNAVLKMYSSLMDLNAASKFFDEMECKDVISWTTMMGLLVDLEYAYNVLELFFKMKAIGVNLDAIVLVHLTSACAILGDLRKGRQIHAQALICGFASQLPLVNSIITMYSKCGDLDSSRTVFDQTPERSLVSWTAVVSGCLQNGQPREALDLVIKARLEESYSFDSIMLVSALAASTELVALEFCKQLHCCILESGFSQYRSIQNSLISAYSKCGNVDLSDIVFREMGSLRDVVSWNAIISGYGMNGHGEVALELYHEMRNGGEEPDSATYLCILSACSHSGLVNDGLIIFNKMMEDSNIIPRREHYGCVTDMLMRAGCFSEMSVFACESLENVCPNVWKALLNGCALHGNVGLAELAAKRIKEKDPGESEPAVLLSNVFASVGRFQDAQSLRLSMGNRGFVKNPGISILNGIWQDCG